jgi:hypothetical protein
MATMDMASNITRHRSDNDVAAFVGTSAACERRLNPNIRA